MLVQGSESDTVVYYLGESKRQNWKHVYTAVTRGRKSVFIVGHEGALHAAVREQDKARRSRLAVRLRRNLKHLQFQVKIPRGSLGLMLWRLLCIQEVLGSNPLGTKTLCWFLLCSHFLSSKLLSNVCHSSQSLRAIVAKYGLKTRIFLMTKN